MLKCSESYITVLSSFSVLSSWQSLALFWTGEAALRYSRCLQPMKRKLWFGC